MEKMENVEKSGTKRGSNPWLQGAEIFHHLHLNDIELWETSSLKYVFVKLNMWKFLLIVLQDRGSERNWFKTLTLLIDPRVDDTTSTQMSLKSCDKSNPYIG